MTMRTYDSLMSGQGLKNIVGVVKELISPTCLVKELSKH